MLIKIFGMIKRLYISTVNSVERICKQVVCAKEKPVVATPVNWATNDGRDGRRASIPEV